jgi:hypothetical protein
MKGEIPKPGNEDSGKSKPIESLEDTDLNKMEYRGFSSSLIRWLVAGYNKIAKD